MSIVAGLEAVDWIAETLRADATLDSLVTGGVWLGTVPRYGQDREIVVPALVIMMLASSPGQTHADDTLFYNVRVQVKVVNLDRDRSNSVTILQNVKTLLHQQSGSSNNASIKRCSEADEVAVTHEPFQGIFYDHIGINFDLFVQSA